MQLSIKIFKIQGNTPWTVEHTTFFALNAMQLKYIYKQPQITSVFTTIFSSLAVALVERKKKKEKALLNLQILIWNPPGTGLPTDFNKEGAS